MTARAATLAAYVAAISGAGLLFSGSAALLARHDPDMAALFLPAVVMIVVSAGALVCSVLALLYQRIRPPFHICINCGYDLRHIHSRRCPECGNYIPLVGPPRDLQEQIIAALRGRSLHDLEPNHDPPPDSLESLDQTPPVPGVDAPERLKKRREAARRLMLGAHARPHA